MRFTAAVVHDVFLNMSYAADDQIGFRVRYEGPDGHYLDLLPDDKPDSLLHASRRASRVSTGPDVTAMDAAPVHHMIGRIDGGRCCGMGKYGLSVGLEDGGHASECLT